MTASYRSSAFSTDPNYKDIPPIENVVIEKTFFKNRIFLNHVDTYLGTHIASFLTDQVQGASQLPLGGMGDGEEEVGEEEEQQRTPKFRTEGIGEKYQVVGTLQFNIHKPTEDIDSIIDETNEELFIKEVLKCAFVVFDITNDESQIQKALKVLRAMEAELDKIKEVGPKTLADVTDVRTFILISTVMTWGLTKPIDREDPTTPFLEVDYRKRKPHPNYKEHIACEREVIMRGKKYSDILKTYVIASGFTYGMEEDKLAFYFKLAWNNEPNLPVFNNGNNYIPFIHVKDLAKVIHGVCENAPNKPHYILAVEQTPCKLKEMVKALSKAMGRGRIKEVPQEEAFLYTEISQKEYEMCTVNLNMEPEYIVDVLELDWQNDLNIAENMANIAAEFRKSRNLKPLRVILHGPPASGKTLVAKKICEYYGAHYISIKTMIEEKIQDLKDSIASEKTRLADKEAKEKEKEEKQQYGEDDEEEEEEEEEETFGELEDLEEQLREIENALNFSDTRKLPDEYVVRLMRDLLKSNVCQNQGYVLDGYPKTMAQAKELFGQAGEAVGEEAEEEVGEVVGVEVKILPDNVISLDATDEFLCDRVMEKPETEIQGTHYEEEKMLQKLAEYRQNNTEDNTVLNFFDELEIFPRVIDIMKYEPDDIEPIFDIATYFLGNPILFEPTVEEELEAVNLENQRKRLLEEQANLAKEISDRQAAETYLRQMEEWSSLLQDLQAEEEKLLTAQSEPLRTYLMQFVFPTLTKGLVETARMKPEDPVDFLAEYLFKENPEGRMFDPSYTREGVHIKEKASSIEKAANELRQTSSKEANVVVEEILENIIAKSPEFGGNSQV